jgi:hypothetical protein
MIIFGTRSMEKVRSTGVFDCPRCGPSRPYHHKSVNRWFTLYFIPVIPLGSIGTYVQCAQCGGTFGEEALSYNAESQRRQFDTQLRGVLILVMLESGQTDPDEMRAIRGAYQEITNRPLAEGELYNDVRLVREAGIRLGEYAQRVAQGLTFDGKVAVLRAAARVLTARGEPRGDRESVLTQLAEAMQVSPQQLQGILGYGIMPR